MLDGITIFAMQNELSKLFINSKIIHIYQCNPYKIVMELKIQKSTNPSFELEKKNKNYYLHLSIHPAFPEIYFSEKASINSINSPFLENIKAQLECGRIISIKQPNFDRILHFKIRPVTRFEKIQDKTLIFEYMGKHSNIILIRENGIIDHSIKFVSSDINRYREIVPGATYIPPPSKNKTNPLSVNKKKFLDIFNDKKMQDMILWKFIQNNLIGLSRQSAIDIISPTKISPFTSINDVSEKDIIFLWKSFKQIFSKIRNFNFSPTIFKPLDATQEILFSIIDSEQFSKYDKLFFDNVNCCLSYYFKEKMAIEELNLLKDNLFKVLKKNMVKLKTKIRKYKEKIDEINHVDSYKQYGEIIKSNLHNIKRGKSEVILSNYFSLSQSPITIPLDPKLSPLENAKMYFKKYRKIKDSYKTIKHYLQNYQIEYNQLIPIQKSLSQRNQCYPDLIKIQEKFKKLGYIEKTRITIHKNRKQKISLPSRYISKDGWIIFVGKNSKQNDLLTFKQASGNDIWLHVKNMFGSHVVIKNKGTGQTPPLNTLIEAANLSLYFSKARKEKKAQVDYTFKKFVKKPRNAKPGMVIYSQEKNLFISLDMNIINHILSRKSF